MEPRYAASKSKYRVQTLASWGSGPPGVAHLRGQRQNTTPHSSLVLPCDALSSRPLLQEMKTRFFQANQQIIFTLLVYLE